MNAVIKFASPLKGKAIARAQPVGRGETDRRDSRHRSSAGRTPETLPLPKPCTRTGASRRRDSRERPATLLPGRG